MTTSTPIHAPSSIQPKDSSATQSQSVSKQSVASLNLSTLALFTQWLATGGRLFLTAPFKLFGLLLGVMVIAGIFQLLPAPAGILLSKWVGAMLACALWPLLDVLAKTGKLSFTSMKAYYNYKALPVLAVLMMLPFAQQLGVSIIMLGEQGIDLLIYGQINAASVLEVAYIFASAAPLAVVLAFVPAFLLLENNSLISALKQSFTALKRVWKAVTILIILNAIVLFLAPFTIALSALLLGPVLLCINYAAYQSMRTY